MAKPSGEGQLGPVIREKRQPDSVVYTDSMKSDDVLDVSEFKPARINHSEPFVERQKPINGIENFWNQAKRHRRKFNGIPREHFHFFLKEGEWQFNNSDQKIQLAQLKQWVKRNMSWLSKTDPKSI